jgi:hypothetical protein
MAFEWGEGGGEGALYWKNLFKSYRIVGNLGSWASVEYEDTRWRVFIP